MEIITSQSLLCYQQVKALPHGTEAVFSFWIGMHFESQVHVLYLCAKCVSVDSLVVFHDRKWRTPDDILKQLQEFGDFRWSYSRTIKTSMQGSGERKTAWLFYRD